MAEEINPLTKVIRLQPRYWEGFATELLLSTLSIYTKLRCCPSELFKEFLSWFGDKQNVNITWIHLIGHEASVDDHVIHEPICLPNPKISF